MDEVGTGALAGPAVVCCVCMDVDVPFEELRSWWPLGPAVVRDSKKTTAEQRAWIVPRLVDFLLEHQAAVSITSVPPSTIDRYGPRAALEWAMVTAVTQVLNEGPVDLLVIDGKVLLPAEDVFHTRQVAEPKADANYWLVAAASILAKASRDKTMHELDAKEPEYGFKKHVGYPTAEHRAALVRHGLSPYHRQKACKTFLR